MHDSQQTSKGRKHSRNPLWIVGGFAIGALMAVGIFGIRPSNAEQPKQREQMRIAMPDQTAGTHQYNFAKADGTIDQDAIANKLGACKLIAIQKMDDQYVGIIGNTMNEPECQSFVSGLVQTSGILVEYQGPELRQFTFRFQDQKPLEGKLLEIARNYEKDSGINIPHS